MSPQGSSFNGNGTLLLPGVELLVPCVKLFAAGSWPVTLGYWASIHLTQLFDRNTMCWRQFLSAVGNTDVVQSDLCP